MAKNETKTTQRARYAACNRRIPLLHPGALRVGPPSTYSMVHVMKMVIKRYRFVDKNGYPAQRVEDSVKDALYVAEADFDAQRLRADTAEADLRALEWKYNNQAETIRQYQDKMKATDQCILDLKDSLENLLDAYSRPDDRICCSGAGCGCMGATNHQQAEHYAKEAIARAALNPNPEAESHE